MNNLKIIQIIIAFFLLASSPLLGQSSQMSPSYGKALEKYRMQEYAKCLKILNRSIRRSDDDRTAIELYNLRACVYIVKEMYNEAIDDLDKAIELGADDPSYLPYCNRGLIRMGLGDQIGGATDFLNAMLLDPENTLLYLENFMPGFIEEFKRMLEEETKSRL